MLPKTHIETLILKVMLFAGETEGGKLGQEGRVLIRLVPLYEETGESFLVLSFCM